MKYIVRDDIEVFKQSDCYMLKDDNGNFVRIKEKEYQVYKLFESERSREGLNEIELTILDALINVGIINEVGKVAVEKKKFNIFNIKLIEFNIDSILNKIKVLNKFIFSRGFKIASLITVILSILSVFYLVNNGVELFNVKTYSLHCLNEVIILYIAIISSIAIHELSHAMTMLHYNYNVKKIGFKLYFLQLLVYCDLSELYITENKKEKINIYSAGVISQIIITAVALCIYTGILIIGNINIAVLLIFAILNFMGAILNIVPLVKFDGYWILTTILGIYNLDSKSFAEFKNIFLGRKFNKSLVSFAILSLAFKMYLVYSTVFIVQEYFH